MTQQPSRRDFLRTSPQLIAAVSAASTWAASAQAQSPQAQAVKSVPIKIGQIGVQHAHATKLAVYRASPDYEVVGIVEPDDNAWASAQRQSAFRDIPRMTEQQLLEISELEAVLVETPVRNLLSVAERCLKSGKHVHLDKPAGDDFSHYQRLIDTARRNNLLVQMGYMYRYNPAVILLRDFLKRGWLGDIFEVHAVISKVVDARDRTGLAQFSGGIMFELGCHVIDLVVGVMGPPTKVTPYVRHSGKVPDKLNDNVLAVLETDSALATVKSSAIEVEGGARRHLVVCGTQGTFHIQPLEAPVATISLATAQGGFRAGVQTQSFSKFSRYVADAADMAQIIRGQKQSDFSYDHDLAVQRTVLEASQMPLQRK